MLSNMFSNPAMQQINEPVNKTLNELIEKTNDYYTSAEVQMLQQQSLVFKTDKNNTKESKMPCIDFNPCKHGICKIKNSTKEFTCECNVGYMGPFCDIMKHPCDFKPCENGVCEIVSSTSYKCLCKPNYIGENCQIGKPN